MSKKKEEREFTAGDAEERGGKGGNEQWASSKGKLKNQKALVRPKAPQPDISPPTVIATTSVAQPQWVLVYNLTVADDRTYFVEGFGSRTGKTPKNIQANLIAERKRIANSLKNGNLP